MRNPRTYAVLIFGAIVLLVAAYVLLIRPWHLHWGATPQEIAMALPGDALAAPDAETSTRAITIHAPASTVWAWLAQTGQNRGGDWYSNEWLENLFAADMRPVEKIDARLQELQVGDELYMHGGAASNPIMAITVKDLAEEKYLVLRGGWTFLLIPLDEQTTRLVVRYPMALDALGHPALSYAIFEPAHFVMESGMMLGLKARAEQDPLLEREAASKGAIENGTR
jgi:hypothetical protein